MGGIWVITSTGPALGYTEAQIPHWVCPVLSTITSFWAIRYEVDDTFQLMPRLAVAAATPILAYLLALTSHLLTDLRPHLPFLMQGKFSTVVYAVMVAPLVPLALAGSLLGGFVFVQHRESAKGLGHSLGVVLKSVYGFAEHLGRVRGVVYLDFDDSWEEGVNVVLTDVGTIASKSHQSAGTNHVG